MQDKRILQTEEYFLQQIKSAVTEHHWSDDTSKLKVSFKNIDFQFHKLVEVNETGLELYFSNCSLSGKRIDITINELSEKLNNIEFSECEINCDFLLKDSKLEYLIINKTDITSDNFHVSSNEIHSFSLVGKPEKPNSISSLILHENKIIKSTDCRLNQFQFLYINHCDFIEGFTLNANTIERLQIEKSDFRKDFEFWKNNLGDFSLIEKSSLGEVKAKQSNFGKEIKFRDVDFLERTDFTELKSDQTNLKFENCTFQKNTYFDSSRVLNLDFKSVVFQGITSFQLLNCLHFIRFETSYFEKIGFFEGMTIGNLNSIDVNTIRTIKGQLSKSESKIEYLKYNAIEQRKHFQKLTLKDSDFYILLLNKWSNDFGRNWGKGVRFTMKISFFFFLLLILTNTFVSSTYPISLNFNHSYAGFSTILSEYLKFTFSLGFSSEEFQSNGYLYIIFVMAKIFIGYGIYQTITAFRKFGKV